MVENKIFRIKPKSGHLVPGATASVEISYAHSAISDSSSVSLFAFPSLLPLAFPSFPSLSLFPLFPSIPLRYFPSISPLSFDFPSLFPRSFLSVTHSKKGYDELPVFFEIINGRHAVVRLRGRTLAPLERYLHFATSSHSFVPIPIGIVESPIQPYRLHNHGDVAVDFSFDLSALEMVLRNEENTERGG
jgi:hypothetical protein